MVSDNKSNQLAIGAAIGAFSLWGVLPIYWKFLGHLDAFDVVCHRVIWSSVMLLAILKIGGEWTNLKKELVSVAAWKASIPAALLIASNWLLFIWAVQNGHVIDTSLGYFLTPLCNVFLAIVFLGESVNRWQTAAIVTAAAGIIYCCQAQGVFPYIALTLAITFSFYSFVKKKSHMTALHGMFLETVFLTPVAIGWLIYGGAGKLQSITAVDWTLLVLAGPMTTIPLLLFAYAAPRTSLINMGMFQFFAPSIALMIGWQIYQEDMPVERWVAFGLVWVSLVIYMADMIRKRRTMQNAVAKPIEPIATIKSSVNLPVARPEVISSK